jgi:hypothetical protein
MVFIHNSFAIFRVLSGISILLFIVSIFVHSSFNDFDHLIHSDKSLTSFQSIHLEFIIFISSFDIDCRHLSNPSSTNPFSSFFALTSVTSSITDLCKYSLAFAFAYLLAISLYSDKYIASQAPKFLFLSEYDFLISNASKLYFVP